VNPSEASKVYRWLHIFAEFIIYFTANKIPNIGTKILSIVDAMDTDDSSFLLSRILRGMNRSTT
jgi:hypothetical protein